MSMKQMMSDDLDIFYDSNDFALSATYNGVDISVLLLDDMEASSNELKVISAKQSDVSNIAEGDLIVLENVNYTVSNFDYKDSYKLEILIALKEL